MRVRTAIELVLILGVGAFVLLFASVVRTHSCDVTCSAGFRWAQGVAVFGALAGLFGLYERRREGGNPDGATSGRVLCVVGYLVAVLLTFTS